MTRDIITSHMCICQVASQQLLPRRSLGAKGKLPQALWPSKALVSAASYDLRGTLEMILKDLKDQISFGNDRFLNIPRIPTAEIWPFQTFKHRSSPRDPTTDNPKIVRQPSHNWWPFTRKWPRWSSAHRGGHLLETMYLWSPKLHSLSSAPSLLPRREKRWFL